MNKEIEDKKLYVSFIEKMTSCIKFGLKALGDPIEEKNRTIIVSNYIEEIKNYLLEDTSVQSTLEIDWLSNKEDYFHDLAFYTFKLKPNGEQLSKIYNAVFTGSVESKRNFFSFIEKEHSSFIYTILEGKNIYTHSTQMIQETLEELIDLQYKKKWKEPEGYENIWNINKEALKVSLKVFLKNNAEVLKKEHNKIAVIGGKKIFHCQENFFEKEDLEVLKKEHNKIAVSESKKIFHCLENFFEKEELIDFLPLLPMLPQKNNEIQTIVTEVIDIPLVQIKISKESIFSNCKDLFFPQDLNKMLNIAIEVIERNKIENVKFLDINKKSETEEAVFIIIGSNKENKDTFPTVRKVLEKFIKNYISLETHGKDEKKYQKFLDVLCQKCYLETILHKNTENMPQHKEKQKIKI